ncbi:MAG: DUF2442 domain-containing protein [bacterium]
MLLDIVQVQYIKNYELEIRFENGEHGVVDLYEYCQKGGIFEKLSDKQYFQQVYVNHDLGTICWPDGVDIAPETLYTMMKQASTVLTK